MVKLKLYSITIKFFVTCVVASFFNTSCTTNISEDAFQAILDDSWSFRLQENPVFATNVGIHSMNDQLPSNTFEDIYRRKDFWNSIGKRLETIDQNRLDENGKINFQIFLRIVKDRIISFKYKSYLMPLNADSGFHIGLALLPNRVPLTTLEDYENYIARLNSIPSYMDDHIALLREGIKLGMTVPQIVLNGYEFTIKTHVVKNPEKSAQPTLRFESPTFKNPILRAVV